MLRVSRTWILRTTLSRFLHGDAADADVLEVGEEAAQSLAAPPNFEPPMRWVRVEMVNCLLGLRLHDQIRQAATVVQ